MTGALTFQNGYQGRGGGGGGVGAPIAESVARVTLTMEEARAAFEEIDKNHDEELSQIEYIKALRSNPELAKRLGTNSQKSLEIVTLRAVSLESLTFENVCKVSPVKSDKRARAVVYSSWHLER